MSDVFSIYGKIGADSADFDKAIGNATDSLSKWGIDLGVMYDKGSSFFKSFGVDIDKFAGQLGTTGPALAGLVGGAAVGVTAITKIIGVTQDLAKEWAGDEVAALRFNAAIESSGVMSVGASERLTELSESMATMTGMAISATQETIAMLVATGRNETEINKMTTAAEGLSVATGTTLDAALTQINMTFSGSIGRLGKMTPALAELSDEELKNGGAVDLLLKQYGSLADTLKDSTDVSLKNNANAWGELTSSMGKVSEEFIKPIRDMITQVVLGIAANETLTAGIGTLGIALVGGGVAIGTFKLAVMALNTTALFGPLGVIAGLLAVTAALVAFNEKGKKIAEETASLWEIDPLAKIEESTKKLAQAQQMVNLAYKQANELSGNEKKYALARADEAARKYLVMKADLEYQKKYAEGTKLIAKFDKENADADAKAAKEKADAEAANIKQIDGRKAAEKIYRDTVLLTEQSVKAKYKTEKEGAADNQKAVEKYIDALIGLGYTFDDTSSIGGKALNDLVLKLNDSKDGANRVSVAFAGVGDTLNLGVLPAFADFGIVLTSIDPEPVVQMSNKIISMEEAMRLVPAAMVEMKPTSDLKDAWDEFTADMKTKGESWTGTFLAIGNVITSSIGAGLIKVGESLVTGAGWNEFGTIALKALASVLEALGAQLAAMAVWKMFVEKDVAGGLMLAAGAAAAFVAAGAASAMAAVSQKASDAVKSVKSLSQALDFSAHSAGDVIKKMAGFPDITAQMIEDEKTLAFFQDSKIKSMNEVHRLTGQDVGDWGVGLGMAKSALNFDLFQIDLLNKKIADAVAYKSKVIQNANDALLISMNAVNAETKASYELFTDADQAGIAFRSILVSLGNAALSFAQSLQNVGTEISSNLIDALSKGLSESDFLQSMKDYILNAVVQAAVYTDEVKLRMGRIGQAIAAGIANGFTSEGGLQSIKDDLSGLYYSVNASSGMAKALVNEVFTGYASGTDYASAGYHMVGEQGPERVYLPQGARVTNAVNTANGLGGSSKNVTLAPVFNSPKAMNQIEQMRALKQYQRDMAFKGVI